MADLADIVIIGGGAAGLMAAIWAGRTAPGSRLVVLDGARKLGAKILVSGGGRCNVTHFRVDADRFAGSSLAAIRKILRRFDVPETTRFFEDLGVRLKQEPTGKLFPVTDDSRTVLKALLDATRSARAQTRNACRVSELRKQADEFSILGSWGSLRSRRVVLATGGRSLPKSGSDGHGYELARGLGHTLTAKIHPALVPLLLPAGHFTRSLSGVTLTTQLTLRSGSGKRIASTTGSTLCTQFGLSGPAVMDISRHFISSRMDDPGSALLINWLGPKSPDEIDRELRGHSKGKVGNFLSRQLPDRLVAALFQHAGVDPDVEFHRLDREQRKTLTKSLSAMSLPVSGDRGFTYAEVTAGGVPLSELNLQTMESRICPGLYICGEICDVDGPIGGFNFQWAWSSGYVAGVSAAG